MVATKLVLYGLYVAILVLTLNNAQFFLIMTQLLPCSEQLLNSIHNTILFLQYLKKWLKM